MNNLSHLQQNLTEYKRKFYINQLLKGGLIFLCVILFLYLIFNTLEYFGNFNTNFRALFLFGFLTIFLTIGYVYIINPIWNLFQLDKKLSDRDAANQIGNLIPEVKDKLLNTLQLSQVSSEENSLLQAAISKKINELSVFNFSNAIHLEENKQYLKYLIPLLFIILSILAVVPSFFVDSTKRIIKYSTEFIPNAPFKIIIQNTDLQVFNNEEYTLKIKLEGNSIPEQAYIHVGGRKQKLEKINETEFLYTFSNLSENQDFQIEAGGFFSANYTLEVKTRPSLNGFKVSLDYPNYIGKKDEVLNNVGNILAPEGTKITWNFDALNCSKLAIYIDSVKNPITIEKSIFSGFEYKKTVLKSGIYAVKLLNEHGESKEKMEYSLSIIPDQFPKINAAQSRDSTLYTSITFGGNISDDYGLTKLKLFYRKATQNGQKTAYKEQNIAIKQNQISQNFYYKWEIDSMQLQADEMLEYYLSVWDNDGIHGAKATQSEAFTLKIPSKKEMAASVSQSSSETESQLNSTTKKAEEIKNDFKKLETRLKGKRQFDWQDKKAIEEMMQKHEELQKEMEQLQQKHEELAQKQDKFDKTSERIAEKTKLLQQLMNEALDEETKKMYQELQKLLQEKGKENETKDLIEKISKKEQNVEKELDRALEMFKQLKFEAKAEDITKKLEELAQKQEELALKTEEKNADLEKLSEEQKKLNEQFDEAKKEMDELKKLNEELENKQELDNFEKEQEKVDKEQKDSENALDKNDKKKAAQSQKNAAKELKNMKEKMEAMQKEMEADALSENMEDLRNILENLVELSYNQEDVMKEFKKVNQQDPRFVQLSQRQLKIKDDSKIVEDSLNALARRVFQIQSFINKELEGMNTYMDEASKAIKARRSDMAAGKQQFAMTSMNNLALLLSDVLKQMQEQSQDQKQQSGSCSKPSNKKGKKKGDSPSMGQLQKKLNKQIEDLKKSGMTGQKLSQELSKLIRQQEQIRNSMKNQSGQPKGGKSGGKSGEGSGENGEGGESGEMGKDDKPKPGKDGKNGKEQGENAIDMQQLAKEMEETEKDLANKQITEKTLLRQQEILNRLLEHEKAQREREEDQKRESKTAQEMPKKLPPSIENYLKEKEKQVELLKTISPSLNSYYKREANEYFEKINR
ncbi:MAG: hypothetical protein EAZ53_00810 [Bacteroidetes bacterium]|nr:MAG: hypothetical protein EAZ53_00810 [Bacteroidota bacterium]